MKPWQNMRGAQGGTQTDPIITRQPLFPYLRPQQRYPSRLENSRRRAGTDRAVIPSGLCPTSPALQPRPDPGRLVGIPAAERAFEEVPERAVEEARTMSDVPDDAVTAKAPR